MSEKQGASFSLSLPQEIWAEKMCRIAQLALKFGATVAEVLSVYRGCIIGLVIKAQND